MTCVIKLGDNLIHTYKSQAYLPCWCCLTTATHPPTCTFWCTHHPGCMVFLYCHQVFHLLPCLHIHILWLFNPPSFLPLQSGFGGVTINLIARVQHWNHWHGNSNKRDINWSTNWPGCQSGSYLVGSQLVRGWPTYLSSMPVMIWSSYAMGHSKWSWFQGAVINGASGTSSYCQNVS